MKFNSYEADGSLVDDQSAYSKDLKIIPGDYQCAYGFDRCASLAAAKGAYSAALNGNPPNIVAKASGFVGDELMREF